MTVKEMGVAEALLMERNPLLDIALALDLLKDLYAKMDGAQLIKRLSEVELTPLQTYSFLTSFCIALVILTISGTFDSCANRSPCLYGQKQITGYQQNTGTIVLCVDH